MEDFRFHFLEDLVCDVFDERIALDALVTDLDSGRVDVEILQQRFVEGFARKKNVKAFLRSNSRRE